ncbi:tRNA A-37 threonylcarbamoyl transferase component Bud32 [Actinomadura coerulea]|uniref:tRNA A-37 threonylcarbamoyl transferase component Bud32 n=1 Tax=Actinomadura coerulea TaxID=46159 RepID=A0A7X0FYW0_9ACTN|nr:class IV lanthionine synthetase LanL [Actinomadura coerulea]MBB6396308.1 tRNA A-37 threonylcarbamoyl transferase component Bud32 [Actinomadura coerulea]
MSGATAAESDDTRLLDVLDRALGATAGPLRWKALRSGMWAHVRPENGECPQQGWKLHVSATPASAQDVLARALPVLLAGRSTFKFAATRDHVAAMNARNTSRGHSGKFITVYPVDDDEAVRLAAELHVATAGLPGPRILSDRPYGPGSLVHYRYGAFVEVRRITNDGFYAWMILDPDGKPVEDRRGATYTPPPWAVCPFPQDVPPAEGQNETDAADRAESTQKSVTQNGAGNRKSVRIGSRFSVHEAIRHTNKGGVYRATDTETGEAIVIKEGRPHVDVDAKGRDTRDRLRTEARVLEAVETLGIAPRPVALFAQAGHLFLAEEMIPGTSLRQWIADVIGDAGWGPHVPPVLEMGGRLADLMAKAHEAGLIVRDFNPSNIMVRPDGTPVMIDLELALTADDTEREGMRVGTPGYSAPEQMSGAAPDRTADYFALGATLCHVLTGGPPYLLDESTAARPLSERLAEWLAARTLDLDLPGSLAPLLLGLMADEPGHRWTPHRAREALARMSPAAAAGNRETGDGAVEREGGASRAARTPSLERQCRLSVAGIVDQLIATMDPESAETLWPASCVHGAPDPCSLQHGAAGTLGALTRCFEVEAEPRLAPAIAEAGHWILRRLDRDGDRPPGLYFGTAGAAWAVLDAGLALDDAGLVEGALAVADRLPEAVPSPDVTHGTAGLGFAALHLWSRTGQGRFAERALSAADALAEAAEEREGGLDWSTPAAIESKLAGARYYGFAHGISGVGSFLLACAGSVGGDAHRALAARVGETLLDTMIDTGRSAMWAASSGDIATAPYWCHGSAGIGGFLGRLGQATGDGRFRRAAEMSARAVMDNRWRAILGQCHGLAGNGDFLLDMAALTGTERYRDDAWRLAQIILANRAHRDGPVVFPDEQGGVSTSWGDGLGGLLGFLVRLQHGTPRQWTADEATALAAGGTGAEPSIAGRAS